MGKSKETSALVDNLVLIISGGVVLSAGLLAPQMLQMLDKPVHKLFDKLDDRDRERKLRTAITYMKSQGLVRGDYDHGLEITKKAQKRLRKIEFSSISIQKPNVWDNKWRLVFFDIPELKRDRRIALTRKLRELGFQVLQQSIWIHPFNCKDEVARVCKFYGVTEWITYIETSHIDNDKVLQKRFKSIMS